VRVRLILVRHAEAAPGEPDELRPLTPAGRDAARELGGRLAAARPDAVLSSPLVRALATATAIGEAAGVAAEADAHLAPGATLDDIRAAVAGRGATVVAVGHVPDLPDAVLELTGEAVRFPPGGTFEVEL
jgi:phosphohistidine phosphatase SixA